jgi:hypothetical protein
VNKFADETEKRGVHQNYHKICVEGRQEDDMEAMKLEISKLKEMEKNWEAEKYSLKEEKKKLEYMIFDLLKYGANNKEKLKKIKLICEE